MPVDVEYQPAHRAGRTGAREGSDFYRALIGAEEAANVGLLSEVVEDVAALERRAGELATLIAGNAPLTLNATKQALARLQRRSPARKARTDSDVLYEPGFSRRLGRVFEQAPAAVEGRIDAPISAQGLPARRAG